VVSDGTVVSRGTVSIKGKLPPKGTIDHITAKDRAALDRAAENKNAGILVTDDQGHVLLSQNMDTPMVPASTLKILTSLAALTHFGPDFRFTTLAAHDPDTHTLYVKGHGDPLFVSEAILEFCRQVVEKTGITQIAKIVVDQSFFAADIHIPGTGRSLNPYDATTGALCANFNTIHFTRDNAAQTYVSAEPQTPLLDIFTETIQKTGLQKGRILLDKQVRPLYPGLLMAHFFNTLGVAVTGPVEQGPFLGQQDQKNDAPQNPDADADADAAKMDILTITSPYCLEQVVQKLLKHSNNFMANQVMLALGADRFGPPATLDKGAQVLQQFAAQHLGWEKIRLVEGSGLSRKNRVTPAQMGKLLQAFMPHHSLLARTPTQYYKTGTLSGIRTRAGYFLGTDNRLYPFVILGSEVNFFTFFNHLGVRS
ncbi:MAG: D-alanyl-D-alanine carboxypeptidase/D-alanyl-D-alanine-endopeptidase, partial [Desulfotignum sp.]